MARQTAHKTENPWPSRVKVVGYDGSAKGRNLVAAAARRAKPGDRLVIVRVLGDSDSRPSRQSQYRAALQVMQNALGPAVLDGIDHELRVVAGRPARALIEVALRCRAAGIVVGTRRTPSRVGHRTIRAELEAGPVPVVALCDKAERESDPLSTELDCVVRDGLDSFPASDPPSSWVGVAATTSSRDGLTPADFLLRDEGEALERLPSL